MGEGAAGAAAVLLGICVGVFSRSPGSSSGACELGKAGASIPLVPRPAGPAVSTVPLMVALPSAGDPTAADDGPEENDEADGSDDVGTLSGSVPVFLVVWASAVVTTPKQMIAAKIARILFSRTEDNRSLRNRTTPVRSKRGMKFRKGTARTVRRNKRSSAKQMPLCHATAAGRGLIVIVRNNALAAACKGSRCTGPRRRRARRNSRRNHPCSRR